MRRVLILLSLMLIATIVVAAPDPPTPSAGAASISSMHPNVLMSPQVSSPPIQFQNGGTPLGVSFTVNCSTGMSCSFVSGVMTMTATGSGGTGTVSGQTAGCYLLASGATASTSSGSVCDNGTTVSTSKALTAGAATFTNITAPQDAIIPIGADPTGVSDSAAALQAAFTAGCSASKEVYIPVGTYIVASKVTAPCYARIRGAGAYYTSITASATGYITMVIGSGSGSPVLPTGYLRDITIAGPGSTNTGYSALQLNDLVQFDVDDVNTTSDDIGFDMINNNYGVVVNNMRSCFGGLCNVGVNLRTGAQSGSDITFNNLWAAGVIAGVSISGNGGGYHFWGGQLGTDRSTALGYNDLTGSVIMDKDYLTGTTGGASGADFHGTSMEGTNFSWVFRCFGQVDLATWSVSANPSSSTQPGIGFYKNSNSQISTVAFHNTAISGNWNNTDSGSPLMEIAGVNNTVNAAYLGNNYIEEGTHVSGSIPLIATVQTWVQSMAVQSALQNYVTTISMNGISIPNVTNTGTNGNVNGAAIEAFGTNNLNLGGSLPVASTGSNNTSIGAAGTLGAVTTSSFNTAVGAGALAAVVGSGNGNNTGLGVGALSATTGFGNTCAGFSCFNAIVVANNNTGIGFQVGQQTGTSNSTFLGYAADDNAINLTNSTVIGYNAVGTASNQTVIGNSSVTDTYFGSVTSASNIHAGALALNGSAPAITATGTTPYINASGPLEQRTQCSFALTTSTFTLALSPVNLCTLTLPNAAVVWRMNCQAGYSVTAGTTPTFAVGNNWAQTPSGVFGAANIDTTNAGVGVEGTTSSTSNGNIVATGALTTAATIFTTTWWTTFTGSATSGAYHPTAALTGTSATGTLVGFCTIQ